LHFRIFEKYGTDFKKICHEYLLFQRKSVLLETKNINLRIKLTLKIILQKPLPRDGVAFTYLCRKIDKK